MLLAGSIALSACNDKGMENPPPAPGTAAGFKTVTLGKLLIGTEGTYPPFSFHDSSGKLTGYDVELAREVAKRAGIEPEFIETKWDGMIAGLDAKRYDMVANEVGLNEERKAKYVFSDPYIVSKAVLIVHNDNTTIKTFADLKGKKAGQTLTSNLGKMAKDNGAEIVQVDSFNQAIDLLLSKRIDATINDSLSYLDMKKQKPDVALKVVAESKNADECGFLFAKGNDDMVKAINKALSDMRNDGTLLKISKDWFGADVTK